MRYWVLIILLSLFSCSDKKVIVLPEIGNAKITEVNDVSAAYLFYDVTQADSVEFNRKNIIGTTNWLVNVDKRLTLKQAMPHIKYLQDKRRNAKMHKNEAARNYFTCNDTIIKNLGFIDFTDVDYITDLDSFKDESILKSELKYVTIHFFSEFTLIDEFSGLKHTRSDAMINKANPVDNELNKLKKSDELTEVSLFFDSKLTFQEYIALKSKILTINSENVLIINEEFIIEAN